MIKNILLAIVVLLVVAVGGVIYYLDSLVRSGVETAGSQVLATEVRLAGVSLSPLGGSGSLSGLTIANPEGFERPYAFELGDISLALNTGSLFTDVVEIDSIVIDSPRITYEGGLRNDNIRALLANIQSGESASAEEDSGAGGGKELIIREFRLLNPQLDVITPLASAPLTMDDIVLTNIGTADNGATARQLLDLVLSAINRAILQGNFPGIDALEQRARQRLQEAETELRQNLDNAVQGVESELRQNLDGAVENLGNSLQNILN